MIIVLGSVSVRPGKLDEALAISTQHVLRSRSEPGCIAHAVHRDAEDERRLVFVEKWSDREALDVHFRVAESQQFVQKLMALCSQKPDMKIYQAEELAG